MVCTGFAELDSVSGGLRAQKDYLVYGAIGGGKTSLALSFLYQGLMRDETVALIMRRRPDAVIAHAMALGWNLQPYLRSGKVILIEYPDDLDQGAQRLHDTIDMAGELRAVLDGAAVTRLVFDPAAPLFAAAGGRSALRMRRVVEGFAALEATCLYVIDTPEGDGYLAACKDYVHGVLHLEPDRRAAGLRSISLERIPGTEAARSVLSFEIRRGEGLTSISAPEPLSSAGSETLDAGPPPAFSFRGAKAPRRSGQLTVLVADPDVEHRSELAAAIQPIATAIEAQGPGDCLARIGRDEPDLIVLAMEMPGISTIEIIRKLRRSGMLSPILVTGVSIRRLSDRVRVLGAGADIALARPFDMRTFKLYVRNLLIRSGEVNPRAQHLRSAFDVVSEPRRGGGFCTSDADEFCARLHAEARHGRVNDLPFTVAAFFGGDLAEEIGGVCSYVSRRDDFTFVGANGAAILLTEANSADGFLERFHEHWKLPAMFEVECHTFDGSETFADALSQELLRRLESRPRSSAEVSGHSRTGFSPRENAENGLAASDRALRAAAGFHA